MRLLLPAEGLGNLGLVPSAHVEVPSPGARLQEVASLGGGHRKLEALVVGRDIRTVYAVCDYCGKPLQGRQKRFCTRSHILAFYRGEALRRHPRKWSATDEEVLREKYPKAGANIPELLGKFTRMAIFRKAQKLGVRVERKTVDNGLVEQVYGRWKGGEPLCKIAGDVGFSDVALFYAVARRYGREEAERLGRLARTRASSGRRRVFVERLDGERVREVFEKYRRSRLNIADFARRHGDFIERVLGFRGVHNLRKAFKHHLPEDYRLLVEGRMARTYQRGRYWEYRVRDHFKRMGYFVWRSPASRGPADLIAIKRGEIVLVQCRTSGSLDFREKEELRSLAESIGAKAYLAVRSPKGKVLLRDVFKIEDRPWRRGRRG